MKKTPIFVVILFLTSLIPVYAYSHTSRGSIEQMREEKEDMMKQRNSYANVERVIRKEDKEREEMRKKIGERTLEAGKKVTRELNQREKLERVRAFDKEDFLKYRRETFEKLKENCDKLPNVEECRQRIQERLEQTGQISDTIKEKLKAVEEKRLETLKKVEEDEDLSHYEKRLAFKARRVEKETRQQALEKMKEARRKFEEHKGKYEETKRELQQLKRKKQECTGAECEQVMQEVITKVKEHLLRVADVMIVHLEELKENIQSNEHIPEDNAQSLVNRIDNRINSIGEVKAEIEAATTKEELREAARKLNAGIGNVKEAAKNIRGKMIKDRLAGIIVQAKHLEAKMDKVLQRLLETGHDTTEVESLIVEYHALVESAKENFEKARQSFEAGNADEGHGFIREAKENLKEARKKLNEIIRAVKAANGEDEIEDVEQEEELEEVAE